MFRIMLFAVSLIFTQAAHAADCLPDQVSLKGDWGQAAFTVEIADTPELLSRGLMFRETMPARSGMLFVFTEPRFTSFWMKNTLISLDILFADAQGVVQTIHHMAKPLDETPLAGGPGIQFVLEINGGIAKMMGIEPGSAIQHPLIDQQNAAWPCSID